MHRLADGETRLSIRDQLVVAARDVAAVDEPDWSSRTARLVADDLQPQPATAAHDLNVLKRDRAGFDHAIDARHHLARVAGNA